MKRKLLLILVMLLLVMFSASALEFNGTVKDENGNALANAVVNVTVRSMMNWNILGYNSTTTNASGAFNLTLATGPTFIYEPVVTANTTGLFTNFRSKAIPALMAPQIIELAGMTFYLSPAGTINITAVNSSNASITFNYQIKDQALGYPIASVFGTPVSSASVVVPKNRNYSIMIYPFQSMPVSFDWNNFSSSDSYNFNDDRSNYNASTYTLSKEFNTTSSMVYVYGYINYTGIDGWDEFKVVPYLLEPGNMIHTEYGDMPFNMSAFGGLGDSYDLTTGFFNISLPATVENSPILLYASARNGTEYYGGFRNISLSYGATVDESLNFTYMRGLFGSTANITMNDMGNPGQNFNVTTKKQTFSLINSSEAVLGNLSAHVEAKLDYSSLGAIEFTWMAGIEQSSSLATFNLILLNSTGIKELNVFANGGEGSGQFAPKRKSYTALQIYPVMNVTMTTFNPRDIDGNLDDNQISIELFYSNSTCDVPNPGASCSITGGSDMLSFNPMRAVFGGGKLSFRMGTGDIMVHYVNVDLLASGPPDAVFESNSTETTSADSFNSAVKFGSGGPTIYDYVLVSMPYTEATSTQSGLNESRDINMSLPYFYDEDDWTTPIWNSSLQGSSASALAGNYTHYAEKQSAWSTLMQQNNCTRTLSEFNASRPCYIDTTNNMIWIRLPHFSGTSPSITGSAVTIAAATIPPAASGDGTSSSSPGGSTIANVFRVAKMNAGEKKTLDINDEKTGIVNIIFKVKSLAAAIKFEIINHETMPESVEENKDVEVYKYFEISTTNLPSDNIESASIKFEVDKAWIESKGFEPEDVVLMRYIGRWQELETEMISESTTKVIYESTTPGFSVFAVSVKKIVAEEVEGVEETKPEVIEESVIEEEEEGSKGWLLVTVIILALVMVGVLFYFNKEKLLSKSNK
ncbi:MAG: PGF-pre-PGF domain-containing protein [Nanoarchaeota archaeon]|nr:PGF-pre-PGF domain-containing protein [Nanoarchaeota archaeon]